MPGKGFPHGGHQRIRAYRAKRHDHPYHLCRCRDALTSSDEAPSRLKTYVRYEAISRLYIVPSIGGMRVEALRPAHIEATLASWISGSRNDRERGKLSESSVKHILDELRTICRWALMMGILTRNPVDAISSPARQLPGDA